MSSLFNLNNDAFASLVLYGSLALSKTAMMALLTARARFRYQAMPSLEDAQALAPNNPEKQKMIMAQNENVERVSPIVLLRFSLIHRLLGPQSSKTNTFRHNADILTKAPAGNMAMLAIWPTAPISVSKRRNIFPFL